MPGFYDLQTDTHLSKDYNKVLQNCMILCNQAKLTVGSTPHFELLFPFFSAVNAFYNNTFFLFENLTYSKKNYTEALTDVMQETNKLMINMRIKSKEQTERNFYKVLENCDQIHMMIMKGLQQRKMLVRMSEQEPKGANSIEHWEEKRLFGRNKQTVKTDGDKKYI